MNAKFVVALILTLQVSSSLSEIPEPSAELLQKYQELRATFLGRLENLMNNPALDTEEGQTAKSALSQALQDPRFQAIARVAGGFGQQVQPHVEVARNSVLGAYQKYVRPYAKDQIDDFIRIAKGFLDKAMPAKAN